jgi:hypothetical protein
MNEHFNKYTGQYRYKCYNQKTQKRCKNEFTNNKNQSGFIRTVNGVQYIYVIHKYKPYFLFRLFWFLISFKHQKPNSKLKPISNQTIITSLMIIGIIIAIIVGWDNIVSFFNKYIFK